MDFVSSGPTTAPFQSLVVPFVPTRLEVLLDERSECLIPDSVSYEENVLISLKPDLAFWLT